ncbi:hypothetical protein LB505_001555 [Fusarium chuoi]|nr:hypothetical protein LB505_001555 [Fusarium chuoi]
MEVVGRRELGFFPGTCRGGAFKGFEYRSERGARAVRLTIPKGAFEQEIASEIISYYNGGGVFVDAASVKDRKVETPTKTELLSSRHVSQSSALRLALTTQVSPRSPIFTSPPSATQACQSY